MLPCSDILPSSNCFLYNQKGVWYWSHYKVCLSHTCNSGIKITVEFNFFISRLQFLHGVFISNWIHVVTIIFCQDLNSLHEFLVDLYQDVILRRQFFWIVTFFTRTWIVTITIQCLIVTVPFYHALDHHPCFFYRSLSHHRLFLKD